MKNAEDIRTASAKLKADIKALIEAFVDENGECEVKISTSSHLIHIAQGRTLYAGHEVEIDIVI